MFLRQSGLFRSKSIALLVLVSVVLLLLLNLVILPLPVVRASTFSVTTTADSGIGSLRQAIIDSNNMGSANFITFSFGSTPQTINLSSALPLITKGVTIDGSNALDINGNPTIELNGASAGPTADGLAFGASNITVKSLVINRFGGSGINIQGPASNNNIVSNSFIGVSLSGNTAQGNNNGIKIQSSSNNIIGGTLSGTRNIISGNTNNGVLVLGPNGNNNSVFGNYIGIGLSGAALPNDSGVRLEGATSSKIGTNTTTVGRNIISGNSQGVLLTGSTTNSNQVMGNYIGTNIAGKVAVSNGYGVYVDGAPTNTIGGSLTGMGNLISGNTTAGILLTHSGTTGNLVEGNTIGTNDIGNAAIANSYGVWIIDASDNVIGGSTVSRRNIISGSNIAGISISGNLATGNKILGNYIGTDVGGTIAVPNDTGIFVSANSNLIGNIGGADGNVISGNTKSGIFLADSTNNQIRQNFIGVNKNGTAALPNLNGILIQNGSSNIIGGTINPQGNRNIISGNQQAGITISGSQANVIQGNLVGLSLSGLVGIPNNDGILLTGASGTIIGAADPNFRNYITSNTNSGLTVTGTSSAPNQSKGNLFGYKSDNTPFVSGGTGIKVFGGGRLQIANRNRVV